VPKSEMPRRRRCDDVDAELVGGTEKRELVIEEYDPAWPRQYAEHEERIRRALGADAVTVEHIGSTSVPGLAAKPIIDILVTVLGITVEEDRGLYERTKKELATRDWPDRNAYADAKTEVIEAIKHRARGRG
jgi:GrpB-like predicted nucleotidyltransferase (UPF0157 family)